MSFSQFKDVIQALISWLKISTKIVSVYQIHKDLCTIMVLVSDYTFFNKELKNRENYLELVRRTTKEFLETTNEENSEHVRAQHFKFNGMWTRDDTLADYKQGRLEEVLQEAGKLYKEIHMLLEELSNVKIKVMFTAPLANDKEIV